jgi:hypothetical protein
MKALLTPTPSKFVMVCLSDVKALAQLVEWNDGRPLSRFESRLPLAEILMKAGSIRHDAIGEKLAELGRSFAHDVLNLAALAGRLLWFAFVGAGQTFNPAFRIKSNCGGQKNPSTQSWT